MNQYAKLTATDRLILESYKSVLDGLSEFLGLGYEIVLHSLEDINCAAIKVINGHYTGRKEGAPITDLALEMLAEIKKSGNNHTNLIYSNRNNKGTPIRSATLPITGENNQIIGLLCINFYMDIPLHVYLESIMKIDNGHKDVVENFANDTEILIMSALENTKTEVFNNPNISTSNKNKEIIALLNDKGVFNLKDAVIKVAENLGISKNTVYLHLRNLSE
ncbi:PAS domain-containing protein [Irregularibacter muris]|uniref:PAS domain-containing protein n=1 Tax=Irregularibacter muris TaxID=1796619 RepID=A0AAE3HGB4_9FIRM|nr:PAS domain-containing protein [Irregularibacter muris]MCR1900111.1 PAS domain-containing protein [Irregularibacter muris]